MQNSATQNTVVKNTLVIFALLTKRYAEWRY